MIELGRTYNISLTTGHDNEDLKAPVTDYRTDTTGATNWIQLGGDTWLNMHYVVSYAPSAK